MKKYPKYIEVNGERFSINTDFRIALECEKISRDNSIGEYEKMCAIVYKLFGERAIQDHSLIFEFFSLAVKYLKCGKEEVKIEDDGKEPSLDFEQDEGYIKASFMSDYRIDLDEANLHFWQFYDLMQGLTESSVLNRVRSIREEPLAGKKGKDLEEWRKRKKQVALKHNKTDYELEMDKLWEKQMKKE
jgi:hypothetical protein